MCESHYLLSVLFIQVTEYGVRNWENNIDNIDWANSSKVIMYILYTGLIFKLLRFWV